MNQLEDIAKFARSQGATAAELVLVTSTDITAGIRMGKQETLERSEHRALGVRLLIGQQQAIVSSDDIHPSRIKELVEQAAAVAKASPADPYVGFLPAHLQANHLPELELSDTIEPDIAALMTRCQEAEQAALAVTGVVNSDGAQASYSQHQLQLFISPENAPAFHGSYQTTSYSQSVTALAGSGTAMEEDYEYASRRFYADLPDAAEMGKKAGQRVITRLNPRSIPSCQLPIFWEPRIGRSLLGQFLQAINGGSVARGSSFLKDKMGQQIFPASIRITDDPTLLRGAGSRPFDGEGAASKPLALVEAGILNHWLLDVRSANKLGLQSNGRARRSLGSPPSAGATNCYMHAGSTSRDDLLKNADKALLVTDVFGMGVNAITGDYSQGARGFLIERGAVAYPVSEITIAGNLLDMFQQLTAADDLCFDHATNVPTLRIDGMTVAGN